MIDMGRRELVNNGKMSKVDRYDWAKLGKPGVFMMVPKHQLQTDHDYQRSIDDMKVRRIASKFSWPAFGTLIVSMRPDGSLWVLDGQHRRTGAMSRVDVNEVPCLVFECADRKQEAILFEEINTNRKAMSGVARFTATAFYGKPRSVLVNEMLSATGRKAVEKAKSGRVIGCVYRMMSLAEKQPELLVRIFPLIDSVVGNNPMSERVLEGLMWVEDRMPEGQSLTDKRWNERLHAVGADELDRAAKRASAAFSRGGGSIWGRGILAAVNKGLKQRLVLDGVEEL